MKKIILALLVLGAIAVSASADQNTTQDVTCVVKVQLGAFQVRTPKTGLRTAQAVLEKKGWSLELQKVVCERPIAKGAAKQAPNVAIATLIAVQQNSVAIAQLKDCACEKKRKSHVQKHKTKKKVSKKHRRQKKIVKRHQRLKAIYVSVEKSTVPFCKTKKARLLQAMNVDKWYRAGCGKKHVGDDSNTHHSSRGDHDGGTSENPGSSRGDHDGGTSANSAGDGSSSSGRGDSEGGSSGN